MANVNAGTIGYLNLIKKIEAQLMAMEYVNTVTLGDLAQIDLNKRTLFPLCHMMINTVDFGGDSGVFNFNVTIMSMDIVNEWKSDDGLIGDPLLMGNDNEQFVLNNTLTVLNKLNEFLYRGSLHNGDFEIANAGNATPFFDRFENKLAGWSYTANIFVRNNIDICNNL